MNIIYVDAQGCACPEPVLKTKKAMEQKHDAIEVLVDNPTAVQNITRFAQNKKYELVETKNQNQFRLLLTKRGPM